MFEFLLAGVDPVSIALITSAIVGAATSGQAIHDCAQAENKAERAQVEQDAKQAEIEKQAEQQQIQSAMTEENAAKAASKKNALAMLQNKEGGRAGTILSDGVGAAPAAAGAPQTKTLLGL